MEHDRTIMNAVVRGIATFIAAIAGLFFVYFILGFVTGIFGMCATASEQWENVYWKLRILIPVIAVAVGIVADKQTIKNSRLR